jgi:phospholipid/cholesterol/gamma-HCH transport system substrate-binding protein
MKRLRLFLGLLLSVVLLAGCDVYDLPLPGGADVGDNPITIKAEFADALDLVPQSAVKVDDITVGKITDITLNGDRQAVVAMELNRSVDLPDNAIAEIRQTSLLGEKFVSLGPPTDTPPSTDKLASGDVIPIERTGRNPEVEEVLGALSLLLNGGGVAQLQTISKELNLALEGHEGSARSELRQIETFTGQLAANKDDIVNAIEALNRLSKGLNGQMDTIDATLEKLPSALTSLDKQRDDLVKMLQSLSRLGDVGVRVIRDSKDATIQSLRQLTPVLSQLENAGDDFVKAFNVFLTYPFVDDVVGRDPQVARNLHMGDYTNLSIQLDITVSGSGPSGTGLPTNLPTVLDPTVILSNIQKCLQSGDLSSKACQKVLSNVQSLTELTKECQKKRNEDKAVCQQLNQVPGAPIPTGSLPTITLPTGLPGLPGGLRALQRPAPWWSSKQGPTMGQLTHHYDPAFVSLLVPGMVVSR